MSQLFRDCSLMAPLLELMLVQQNYEIVSTCILRYINKNWKAENDRGSTPFFERFPENIEKSGPSRSPSTMIRSLHI